MMKTNVVRKVGRREEDWRERIAAQERSGVPVKQFCAAQGFTEQSFYSWRKRLSGQTPMRFALVAAGGTRELGTATTLELVLASGERLRIGAGVDPTELRKVLEALRA